MADDDGALMGSDHELSALANAVRLAMGVRWFFYAAALNGVPDQPDAAVVVDASASSSIDAVAVPVDNVVRILMGMQVKRSPEQRTKLLASLRSRATASGKGGQGEGEGGGGGGGGVHGASTLSF